MVVVVVVVVVVVAVAAAVAVQWFELKLTPSRLQTTTREEQEAYVTALGRLADHLNKKRKIHLDSDAETSAPVSFQLGRRFPETFTDGLGLGATNMPLVPRRVSYPQRIPMPDTYVLCLRGSSYFGHVDDIVLRHACSVGGCHVVYSRVFVSLSNILAAAAYGGNPSRVLT